MHGDPAVTGALGVIDPHPLLKALEAGGGAGERDYLAVGEQVRAVRERVDQLGIGAIQLSPGA